MINVVILDDQEIHLKEIEKQILSLGIDEINIQKYLNEEELLKDIKQLNEYSIFMIDIVLNNKSGVDVAQVINQELRGAIVIFISSYLDKVVDIYDANHYYFIYKPELEKRLPIAFKKALKSLNQIKETLPLTLKGKTIVIHPADILYLERKKRTTTIIDGKQALACPDKLDQLADKLPPYFIRCHVSYMVNAQKVVELNRTEFILEGGISIPISRAYQKHCRSLFQEYLMGHL